MKGLSAAFHDVQFQTEVRRTQPLSLKLTRLGGVEVLDGVVRALRVSCERAPLATRFVVARSLYARIARHSLAAITSTFRILLAPT